MPFTISVSPQQLILKRGQTAEIKVDISAAKIPQSSSNSTVEMVASGTFTPGGNLGNSTGTFSQASFPMPAPSTSKQVSFIFTPAINQNPGDYMLMIGTQNNEVGILKAVKVRINS